MRGGAGDHHRPLRRAAGAVDADESVHFFNAGFQSAPIPMRSAVQG